eukprot:751799-Hanusia_phi.AAC.4
MQHSLLAREKEEEERTIARPESLQDGPAARGRLPPLPLLQIPERKGGADGGDLSVVKHVFADRPAPGCALRLKSEGGRAGGGRAGRVGGAGEGAWQDSGQEHGQEQNRPEG